MFWDFKKYIHAGIVCVVNIHFSREVLRKVFPFLLWKNIFGRTFLFSFRFILFDSCFLVTLCFPVATIVTKKTKTWKQSGSNPSAAVTSELSQESPEPGSKSQLSEKSPLEPLDDEVEEAPLDREVPSKPAELLPSEDLGIAQSEPSSELGMFFHEYVPVLLSWLARFPLKSIPSKSLEHILFLSLLTPQLARLSISRIV